LSVALHRRYNHQNIKLNILGVDIDEALIKRANDSLINNDTTGKQSDIAGDNAKDTKQDVIVKDNTKGEISDKVTEKAASSAGGIKFVHADVMSDEGIAQVQDYLKSQDVQKFDMIFLFSVSMWIHLHHGDSGLSRLLEICSRISRYTLLEPQPWKCYQTAARRMRKLSLPEFPNFSEIKLRGENLYPGVLDLARSHNMEVEKEFGQTKWNRKLILFESVEK